MSKPSSVHNVTVIPLTSTEIQLFQYQLIGLLAAQVPGNKVKQPAFSIYSVLPITVEYNPSQNCCICAIHLVYPAMQLLPGSLWKGTGHLLWQELRFPLRCPGLHNRGARTVEQCSTMWVQSVCSSDTTTVRERLNSVYGGNSTKCSLSGGYLQCI